MTADELARYDALLQLLQTADTLWNASRAFFQPWDLGPSQFNVLNLLHSQPEGLSQTELSRQLIMHRSNITGLVDRLEHRGLVRRKDVAADRRAYRVVLTPQGEKLMGEILPRYHATANDVLADLPAKRARELLADLKRIASSAEHVGAQTSK